MRATIDSDRPPWSAGRDARRRDRVVWEAHLGGWPVMLLGFESRPLVRYGQVPADGPDQWTAGHAVPALVEEGRPRDQRGRAGTGRWSCSPTSRASTARRSRCTSGSSSTARRSGGRWSTSTGRSSSCVVSRYHGGAFVVFSRRLNDELEAAALEGSHASVIGGAPAAAVVFAREVDKRTAADPRIRAADQRIEAAEPAERAPLREQRVALWEELRSAKLGELANEFDRAHSVERALAMGSVGSIISAASLRPYLIDAVERGMRRTRERAGVSDGRVRLADPLAG